jgi:uncharacterized damage-inducible protein DinB
MNNQGKENGHPERANEQDGRCEALDALRRTAKRLRRALRDARRKDLAARPSASAWSVRDVIGHLSDHEVILGARLRLVASMERPALPAYDQDLFAARLGNERAELRDLLGAFRAAREANLDLLERLPEEAWARTGVHPERGELSLETLVRKTAEHDRVHEAQVARTLDEVRAARRAGREERRAAKELAKAEAREPRAKKSAAKAERAEPEQAAGAKAKSAKGAKGAKQEAVRAPTPVG